MSQLLTFPFTQGKNQHIVFIVESQSDLTHDQKEVLQWILKPVGVISPTSTDTYSFLVGPNLKFETPESEKLRTICKSIGLKYILRIEKFRICFSPENCPPEYDKMTESVYSEIPVTLIPSFQPVPTKIIDLLSGGKTLFEKINKEFGMGMDAFDINYYYDLFVNIYNRNPTEVELMQVAQGNSSHCRHWEFSGKFIIDGVEKEKTLFKMVKDTLKFNPKGSVKAFKDNGGIIEGGTVEMFLPKPNGVYQMVRIGMNHTATAETHNHPTLISPYPGAATGVGGRLRDIAAIGRGSLIGFGGVYFQTGNPVINIHILSQ